MRYFCLLLAALGGLACGDDGAPAADAGAPDVFGAYLGPDDWCPGKDHCTGAGDGQLHVGVARVEITPDLGQYETEFQDLNGDACWDRGDEDFTDTNGNGKFDALWIGGFCGGRPAVGIADPLWVRAIALRHNDTTVVVAYIDSVGMMIDEFERIEADPRVAALDVDHIILGTTHDHESPDLVGIWNQNPLKSGVDPDYLMLVRDRAAEAIVAAVDDARPAKMLVAQRLAVDPVTMVAESYIGDAREPMIFDPTLTVIRFVEEADPAATIGTLVNFAGHPEFTGSENGLVTADFPGYLRDVIEEGLPDEGLAGVGGTTIFVQGPLGGQIGPKNTHPIGPDGLPIQGYGSFPKAEAEGKNLGRLALEMLGDAPEEVTAPALSYRTAEIYARIDNVGYQAFGIVGVIDRQLFGYDPDSTIDEDNTPWLRSRISYVQLGPVAFITSPGELHPELFVGGYDGSWSWGQEILPEPVNAPDLGLAPQPPYLRDLMLENPGVTYTFCAGLAGDFFGYIVAEFNYMLHPDNPYIEEADGHHYEETNSIGPEVERQVQHPMMELARWRAPAN